MVLALLRRIPPPLLALLLGRLGTALLLWLGSRWLLRASVCSREDSGWPFCSPVSAREASGTPAGVPPASSEEEIFLAVLGVHLELPPVVQVNRGDCQAVQHRRPHFFQWSARPLRLDRPFALLLLPYPHCQSARSCAAPARPAALTSLFSGFFPGGSQLSRLHPSKPSTT